MQKRKVLLVGWDAADWKVIHPLMDAGKMPHLQRIVEGGVMANMATLHPPLSPMLWTSIATGKRPFQHGIHGFSEPSADGLSVQPISNLSRRAKAVWNIFNQNDLRSIVIGWWPSNPAEPLNGVTVSDHYHRSRGTNLKDGWLLLPGTVHPPELAEPLAEIRLHYEEVAGEMLLPFVPKAREIDQNKDRRLTLLAMTLAECVSIHSAATWLLDNQEWDFFAVYYDAIDHFSHGFMKYHPPRQEHIAEADFELYQHVVSTAYQFHDQMLGTLLRKAGEDVTALVISDHGFHPDHMRPKNVPHIPAGPAIEHRDFGIFAARGPGLKRDEHLYGVGVLDVAPTLLALYDLPAGEDMDGKVIASAFEEPPSSATVPSWERIPGEDGRHPPHTRLDPEAAQQSLDQLVALGYIAKPDENREKAVAETIQELRFNLAESYQDAGRHAEAAAILRELRSAAPDEVRFAVDLFFSCQALDLIDEMRAIVADLDGRRRTLYQQAMGRWQELAALARERREQRKAGAEEQSLAESKPVRLLNGEERAEWLYCRNLARFHPPVVDYLRAQVLEKDRLYGQALEVLEAIQQAQLTRPGLLFQVGDLYRKMGLRERAEEAFNKALFIDPESPQAHFGLALMSLRRGDPAAAADRALNAIQQQYHFPAAHFILGNALVRLKQPHRAADAYRAAVMLNPNFAQAHLRLAVVLRGMGDAAGFGEHWRMFRELRAGARMAAKPSGEDTALAAVAVHPPKALRKQPMLTAVPALSETVVVVSGLPRSGTSMLMQMLSAGGLPILSDGERKADADNPRGYLEYEPVKRLYVENSWMKEAQGKAVKVVAPLLSYLPADLSYSIIFIQRDLDEVLASQQRMLVRLGARIDSGEQHRTRLLNEYRRIASQCLDRTGSSLNMRLLVLYRVNVLSDPPAAAAQINAFLGGGLATDAMAAQVDRTLHRQRSSATLYSN